MRDCKRLLPNIEAIGKNAYSCQYVIVQKFENKIFGWRQITNYN